MCTNDYLVKSKITTAQAKELGVTRSAFRFGDFKPASTISIVIEEKGTDRTVTAT